jgi:serine/threonine protein phosphatase 1
MHAEISTAASAYCKLSLDGIGFNPEVDRLFSVGDLVDRGPDSELALEWIAKPWFHAVQGNHEDMAIRYVTPGNRDAYHYAANGGAWLIGKTMPEQQEYAIELAALPYAIEVETADGLVGIVHADVSGGLMAGDGGPVRRRDQQQQTEGNHE